MRSPRSKTGCALAALYAVGAAVLFYQAITCTGWLCHVVAVPAMVPFGVVLSLLIDWLDRLFLFPGYSPDALILSPYYIVVTVLGNMAFYYGLGAMMAAGWKRLRVLLGRRAGS